jgi:ribonuclease E
MKNRIFIVWCIALVAGGVSVRADDTPDQAAARAALEQKMEELDHSPAQPPPDTNSVTAMVTPAGSTTNATNTIPAATAAAPAAPMETIPAAAPATEVPAPAAPVSAAPADANFSQEVPPANASDQAAALEALERKMRDLDQGVAQPPPDTNSVDAVAKPAESATNTTGTVTTNAVTLQTAPAAAPANESSSSADAAAQAAALAAVQQKMNELNQPEAQPVTETPKAQAPVAISPGIAPATAAPLSAAPAVVAPAPEVSAAPAAAPAVAIVPAATAEPVAVPAETQLAAPKPAPAVPAPMILPYSSPGQARPDNQLATVSGAIYKSVEVESVKDDGIIISYTAANGSWGMTKVYFEDLPAEIRQQYGK